MRMLKFLMKHLVMRGTEGCIIYRYNGRYYVKSMRSDSYPAQQLVGEIPNQPYAEWLIKMKEKYQRVEESIFGKDGLTPIDVTTIPFEECLSVIPLERAPEGGHLNFAPTFWPPPNTIHFPLSGIRDTWIKYINLRRDGGHVNVESDSQTLDINHPKPAVDETHVELYEKANCSTFREVFEPQSSFNFVHEGLCFELAKILIEHNELLFYHIPTWGPEDPPFKQLAFVFLCLADRCSFSLLPTPTRPDNRTNIEDRGVPYPATSSFWFADTFVYLTTHLKDDKVRKAAIGHVLELTEKCPRSKFTAFLFSISDLVIIDISEEGIRHTETLPFYDIAEQGTDNNDYWSPKLVHNVGLLAMITYLSRFRTSSANHRAWQNENRTSSSSLPYNILLNIVECIDWETAVILSATSKLLRHCVERTAPKFGSFRLLKYKAESKTFLARRDGNALVEIHIKKCSDMYWLAHEPWNAYFWSAYYFIMKICYPGVQRQWGFMPPIVCIENQSDFRIAEESQNW